MVRVSVNVNVIVIVNVSVSVILGLGLGLGVGVGIGAVLQYNCKGCGRVILVDMLENEVNVTTMQLLDTSPISVVEKESAMNGMSPRTCSANRCLYGYGNEYAVLWQGIRLLPTSECILSHDSTASKTSSTPQHHVTPDFALCPRIILHLMLDPTPQPQSRPYL